MHSSLRVIPLGGLGEIGKNMMALEYGDDIVVIDCGVLFPEEDMPGVDLVIPDITYLLENADRVRAILITHGHEDHTGALPYVLSRLNVPVYAPRLAHGLIRVKLRQRHLLNDSQLEVAEPGCPIQLGNFEAEFFRVCHSIPDSMGIVLRTPLGTVVHTGDFKIDHTPVDGMPTSLGALASHCEGGTLLLMSDSTYAELPGYTPSERVVGEALQRVIAEADGRVLVATFASLISRIQQVLSAAVDSGRHVAIVGRSMVDNVNMSMQMGYISVPDGLLVSVDEARGLDADRVVLMTTGSQGEPTSALARIANQNHREISIMPGDTVVISATPIPGNELSVSRIIDNLFRQGATVLYDRVALVHVHGHASAEELKLILNLTAPSYFVPIHGEYRHLLAHASLARDVGIPDQNLFVLEDGDILELDEEGGRVVGSVPAGHVFVEGNTLWSADSPVLSERWRLSRDGVMIVTMQIDDYTGLLAGTPEIVSRGVVKPVDLAHLAERVSAAVDDLLEKAPKDPEVWANTKAKLDQLVGDLVYKETGRRPMIVVTASEAL